eukprot:7194556-Prymnesium_polylepis.1
MSTRVGGRSSLPGPSVLPIARTGCPAIVKTATRRPEPSHTHTCVPSVAMPSHIRNSPSPK